MNRWKVESTDYGDFRLWFVFERARNGTWWCQRGEFNTHAEALAYADRMARTVEVVLPREAPTRIPAHNGPQDTPWYTFTSRNEEFYCALTIWGPGGEIGILDKRDLKPLALALLAHYYQQEKK